MVEPRVEDWDAGGPQELAEGCLQGPGLHR